MALSARLTQQLGSLAPAGPVRFAFAPGRINVLGEHTDTSEGFALPAAVDRGLLCAFSPAAGDRLHAVSLDVPGRVEISPDLSLLPDPVSGGSASYGRYLAAVAGVLRARGIPVGGACFAFGSTIPAGGGMSSSAALCVAFTLALASLADVALTPLDVALAAQAAEHLVGVRCGLMDQYAIAHGKVGHALLLDTRTKTHQSVPLQLGDFTFVVGDTRTPRGLVDSEYNARRNQVEEAARLLDDGSGRAASLRDVDPELLSAGRDILGPLLFRRASHVVSENARTLAAAELLGRQGEDKERITELGRLLDASHASLRDLFEVSCPELDALVLSLTEQGDRDVAGARMMGGGFGGCILALVRRAALPQVLPRGAESYRRATGKQAAFFPVEVSCGARLLSSDDPFPETVLL